MDNLRRQYFHPRVFLISRQDKPGARPGIKRPHRTFQIVSWLRPIETAFAALKFFCVGYAVVRLWLWRNIARAQIIEGGDDHCGAQRSQGVVQILCRGGRRNRYRLAPDHGAGIEAFVHRHDGDPGLGVTAENSAMNGCSPPPARQQGRVHIYTAKTRRCQHGLRQDEAISRDHGDIGLKGGKFLLGGVVFKALRRAHG